MKCLWGSFLKSNVFAILIIVTSYTTGFSQGRWEYFGKVEALLDPVTFCLFADSDGNVWFGHEFGITKYDGLTYTKIPSEEILNSAYISSIDEIWMEIYGLDHRMEP